MKKLTPKGIIGLSTTAFLFFVLTSLIYFNDQVEFNPIEAKWELNDIYKTTPASITEILPENTESYLIFDGINDYVQVPYTVITSFPRTVNARVNLDSLSSGRNAIVETYKIGGSDPWKAFSIEINNGLLRMFWQIGTSAGFIDYNVSANTWLDITSVVENGRQELWVNGILVGSDNDTNLNFLIPDGFYIGTYRNADGRFFGGYIDNVSVYDIALSTSTIQSIHNNDLTLIGNESGLQAYYNFNEGSGNILNDISGNNNDGTIVGASWNIIETIIITTPAIDTYQVFENIRNNASTVNPLGFMNTLVSIPAQAVGYYDAFTDFVTGGFGIFDIPDMTFSELSDTWWARLPIIYDKFNERYGPLGD